MKIAAILYFALVFFICLSCIACTERPNANTLPNDKKALEAIKKEKWLEEAFITDADVLYVSMRSYGKQQLGYARYLCTVLDEYQTRTNMVKIVEYGTADANNWSSAYGVVIGECFCPQWIEGFGKPKSDN